MCFKRIDKDLNSKSAQFVKRKTLQVKTTFYSYLQGETSTEINLNLQHK